MSTQVKRDKNDSYQIIETQIVMGTPSTIISNNFCPDRNDVVRFPHTTLKFYLIKHPITAKWLKCMGSELRLRMNKLTGLNLSWTASYRLVIESYAGELQRRYDELGDREYFKWVDSRAMVIEFQARLLGCDLSNHQWQHFRICKEELNK